ncbi:hypothetical protein E3N88_13962 [Mikania micrantha]|uniref:Uncharacterized protein n=1 Tax=Mikania micrantha TaxID=192012 RepID=A0A5N6P0G0_9ASTR|nr:hypothetical protein E3N88_13962 [Mikania micrantha]
MSRRKKLNIITTDSYLALKDHVAFETQGFHKSEMEAAAAALGNQKKTKVQQVVPYCCLITKAAGHHEQIVVPSTSNAIKQTLSETIEGNKRRAKRRMVLIDEADDEDDDIFEEDNRVDMEVDDFHHVYEYENMDDTVHTNNRFDAQMIDHDNLQQQIQHPDNEKATCAPKKVRSLTQKAEIWKMVSNERILFMFNKFGKPVGDEDKELVQYLGTLVRMLEHLQKGSIKVKPKLIVSDNNELIDLKFLGLVKERNWDFDSNVLKNEIDCRD